MKIKRKLLLFLSLAVNLVYFSACNDDLTEAINKKSHDIYPKSSLIDNANSTFATILAKAIENREIREFIKEKSLEQLDKDYDVIYHLVKNDKLANGKTFRETLSQYCNGLTFLDSITEYDATLTILVPYIDSTFNATTWDINKNESPKIVLRNHLLDRTVTKLRCFEANGNEKFVNRYEKPEDFVLVIKSNERLVAANKNSTQLRSELPSINELKNKDGVFAYIIDDEFNNLKDKVELRNATTALKRFINRSQKSLYPYFYKLGSHRDYVYYGIDPGEQKNTGNLNSSLAEYLYKISFNTPTSYDKVVDKYDQYGDYTDGSLEIYIDLIFNRRSGAAYNLRKILHIPIEKLFGVSNNQAYITREYILPTPLELFVWDFYEFGDTYKVSVSEHDNGTETTISHTLNTVYSHNWGANGSAEFGDFKVGANYGGSITTTKTSTTTTKLTNNSDELGEFFVNFFDPIYTSLKLAYMKPFPEKLQWGISIPPCGAEGFSALNYALNNESSKNYSTVIGTKVYDTGAIVLTIVPLEKQ